MKDRLPRFASQQRSRRPCSRSRRTMSAPVVSARSSCFAVRIDQGRGDRFARRLPAPQHELEDRIEALALLDRSLRNRLRLLEAQALIPTRVEDRRMAEQHESGTGPHLEMAEPQLLVDQAQRLVDREPFVGPDLDVREGEELQHLVFGPPHPAKLVLRPAAGRRRDDLAVARPLAGPPARLEILLENLDRSAVVALVLDFFLAQVHAPGFAFFVPPRLAPLAGPATLASRAAMRAFRISFSSRAAAAIALTASNSSRPTKSAPPIHSLNFSRALASASRPMPAKVPAKPFTIFTKSSNTLFSDCIATSPFRRGNRELRRNLPPRRRNLSPTA